MTNPYATPETTDPRARRRAVPWGRWLAAACIGCLGFSLAGAALGGTAAGALNAALPEYYPGVFGGQSGPSMAARGVLTGVLTGVQQGAGLGLLVGVGAAITGGWSFPRLSRIAGATLAAGACGAAVGAAGGWLLCAAAPAYYARSFRLPGGEPAWQVAVGLGTSEGLAAGVLIGVLAWLCWEQGRRRFVSRGATSPAAAPPPAC